MKHIYERHYIDGEWQKAASTNLIDVINPATGLPIGRIASGTGEDVDRAVVAARRAFPEFSSSSRETRLSYLFSIAKIYESRLPDLAAAITEEMGAPTWLAAQYQAPLGLAHIHAAIAGLEGYDFEEEIDGASLIHEAIGVCALISPWNWPLHQIMCKVAAALAAGCTVVIKPSQLAPINACILAEIMDASELPNGVFNLVNGRGSLVGNALATHDQIDMVSFTGSQKAGVSVAQAAAPSVKRVVQELGGKSANIILDDADLELAVAGGVQTCFVNSGQNCIAPSRMLISNKRYEEAIVIARRTAEEIIVGMPLSDGIYMGPVANEAQFLTTQSYIQKGINEGARLVSGGLGRPVGLDVGYYVKPTIFVDVNNSMVIAREEVFGPLLAMIPYEDVDQAVAIANDTTFGLAGYVSGSPEQARAVGSRIRAGNIYLNGGSMDVNVPFGGYKQSGNGKEFSTWGLEEFLETKALIPPRSV